MIKLSRIVNKKQVANLLQDIADNMNGSISVFDAQGALVFGPKENGGVEAPLVVQGEQVGSVRAEVTTAAVAASVLSCYVTHEREKALLSNETLEKYNELSVLYEVPPALSGMQTPETACAQVLEGAMSLVACDAGVVSLAGGENAVLRALALAGDKDLARATLDHADLLIAEAMDSGAAGIVNDTAADFRFASSGPGTRSKGAGGEARALLCAPLQAQGASMGVLLLISKSPREYVARDVKLLACLACQLGLALQNERRGRRLEKLAALLKPGPRIDSSAGE